MHGSQRQKCPQCKYKLLRGPIVKIIQYLMSSISLSSFQVMYPHNTAVSKNALHNWFWQHIQNENSMSNESMCGTLLIVIFGLILYCITNEITYTTCIMYRSDKLFMHSWVLFGAYLPAYFKYSGYICQNKPLSSAQTVHHSSLYIILNVMIMKLLSIMVPYF